MSDLSDILPDFARDRQATLRDLSEKQAQNFEKWAEEQRQRDLDRINKIIAEAQDASPHAAQPDAAPRSDAADLRRELERNGSTPAAPVSIESRIRGANDK